MKLLKSNLALLCIVCLLCGVLLGLACLIGGDAVFAVGQEGNAAPVESAEPSKPADAALALTERDEKLATRLAARNVQPVTRTVAVGTDAADYTQTATCTYAPVYVDGVFGGYCYVLAGTAYAAIPDYCDILGLACSAGQGEDGVMQYTVDGAVISIGYGDTIYTANGRYFYVPGGVKALDGQIVLPLAELQKIFGAAAAYDAEDVSVSVDTANLALLESGESYYAKYDLYWLSRIIFAESGNQPMEGMIGVGNVVLNRVASASFPDTIQGVVFDARGGCTQFTPVSMGTIYNAPSEQAVLAAKLCLEGANTVGGALYFINPAACNGGWFNSSLTWVATIGDHVFYA